MKKILSFLTKKPLAMAAVALFSMSSFAQETPAGGPTKTDEVEKTTVEMWAKVSASNPLHYFDRVTVVDDRPSVNLAYADDGEVQIAPVPFKTEAGGTSLPKNASYFWVAQGTKDEFFSLSKHLKQDADGVYQRIVGYDPVTGLEVYGPVDYKEGETPTEGAYGDGAYMDEDGKILYPTSDLVNEICWQWKEMSSDYYLFNASNRQRYAYYNTKENLFKTTDTESGIYKAKLYKVVNVFAPYFKPGEGYYKTTGTNIVEIKNDNKDATGAASGTIWWRYYGEETWRSYDDGGIPVETGVETTIETKIEFEGGETPIVTGTFLYYSIEDPTITPEPTTEDKVDEKGEFNVTIASTETEAGLKWTTEEVTEETTWTPETSNTTTENIAEGLTLPATVTVSAKATKTIVYKGEDVEVESNVVAKTYTINPFADAQDVFTGIKTNPVEDTKVPLGQKIELWYEITEAYKAVYTIKPNLDVKQLELKFKGIDEPYKADVTVIGGKMTFDVPTDEKYANGEFEVTSPAGAYFAFTGDASDPKNKVETSEDKVRFYTDLAAKSWTISPAVKYLTTDENTVEVRVWPSNDPEDTPVEFNPEALNRTKLKDGKEIPDPAYGTTFAKWENDPMTNVESVVKKDGTPNTFIVTFFNDEGKAKFIEDFLMDDLLGEVGYALGFPEGTFIAGTNTNGNGLTSHIYFTEAVELTVKPVLGKVCEGYDGIPVLVTAKGKVKGTDYSTPYWLDKDAETVNPAASKIELNAEVEVKIEGFDINNKDVKLTAILKNLPAKELWNCKDYDSKDIFYISYPRYSFDEDNGTDYKLTIPEGAFTINKCQTKIFEGSVDVLAHPIWEATVAPYTFEEGKTETSTLTLNCKVTLTDNDGDFEDDKAKKFEKQVQKWHETRTIKDEEGNKTDVQIISVDDTPVTSWTLTNISGDQTDKNGLKYRTFDVVLELANPIKDVAEHKVNVYEFAFRANVCHSKDMELTAYPKITYGIEQVKYVVSTEAKSVSYNLYAILPDGSRLDKVVGYVGETKADDMNEGNAIAFNDGVNATASTWKYPVVEVADATSESEVDGEAVTEYTLNFPENSLQQNQYKMNFPAGTLQVEGYIANESPLAVPFDVVNAIVFDATSNEEHYNNPATDPKEKEYNISTTDTEITLYLTGLDLFDVSEGFSGNANKVIKLVDGDDTKLGFSSDEVLKLKNIEDGKFTVTFTKDDKATGLEEGTYKMTVPAKSVMNKNAVKLFEAGDIMVDEEKYIYNPEAFVLTINVLPAVDFIMDPQDDPYTEETTEFVVKVNESTVATTFVGSTPAYITGGTLDEPVNVTLTPIEDKPGFMTVTGFGTLAKGEYTITSPVGGLKANNSVQKTEVSGDFEVVKAFVFNDDFQPESGVHVSTKAEDVVAGTYDVLTYKRTFNTTGYQALNLPFSIVYDEKVSDKVELYRISFFHNPDANGNGELDDDEVNNAILELRPLKEGDKTIANKPYVVKAKETGNVIINFTEKEMVEPKPDFVECSTVFNKYTFTTNTEVIEQSVLKADNKYILTGGKIQGAGGFLRYWRWYMTTTELGLPNDFYVKFAVDGELYDEDGFATGIKLIDASDVQGDVYNVAGQRLNAPAKGQVNIVNGKKIFVK